MRPEITPELLRRIKEILTETFGDRLHGVVLYGSEARDEAEEDSDIDFLVLLEPPIKFGEDLRKIIRVLYPLQLEVIRPLHAIPTDVEEYWKKDFPLYINASQEGIVL